MRQRNVTVKSPHLQVGNPGRPWRADRLPLCLAEPGSPHGGASGCLPSPASPTTGGISWVGAEGHCRVWAEGPKGSLPAQEPQGCRGET